MPGGPTESMRNGAKPTGSSVDFKPTLCFPTLQAHGFSKGSKGGSRQNLTVHREDTVQLLGSRAKESKGRTKP